MKKILFVLMCMAVFMSLTACQNKEPETVQIPNPFTEYKTIEEAEKAAGFSLALPAEWMNELKEPTIRVSNDGLLELIFQLDDEEIRIRKAKTHEDISGDYTKYAVEKQVDLASLSITLKGDADLIHTAIWQDGEYSYAISSQKGMKEDAILSLIQKMQH